eukprot:4669130-Prymnesium_polylepis.1
MPRLSERISSRRCSESRLSDRQQAKGSSARRAARLRNVRQRAPVRPRGGGRRKGALGKGACEGGKRDCDGVLLRLP